METLDLIVIIVFLFFIPLGLLIIYDTINKKIKVLYEKYKK